MHEAGFPVSHQRISDYERGTLPSEGYVAALETALDLDEGALLNLWLEERRGRLVGRRTSLTGEAGRPIAEPEPALTRLGLRRRRVRTLVAIGLGTASVAAIVMVLMARSEDEDRTVNRPDSTRGDAEPAIEGPVGAECSAPVGEGDPMFGPQFVAAFEAAGGESALGCAINGIHEWGPGLIQDLRGGQRGRGALMALRPEHVVVIDGDSWIAYERTIGLGGPGPELAGYPVSVDEPCPDGRLMQLAGGSAGGGGLVQRSDNRQWIWVYGPIWSQYLERGGPTGRLGFPIARVEISPDGLRQEFDGGEIVSDSETASAPAEHGEVSLPPTPLC
jgi:hypothetical protein